MSIDVDPFVAVHRRSSWRRWAVAAALLVAAVVIVVVIQQARRWESRPISEVWITSDTEVSVFGHCHRSARVQVDATGSAVVLDLQTRGDSYGDCLDGVAVQLDEELGGREMIDASTGAPVPFICAAEGSSCSPASNP